MDEDLFNFIIGIVLITVFSIPVFLGFFIDNIIVKIVSIFFLVIIILFFATLYETCFENKRLKKEIDKWKKKLKQKK